MLSIKDDQINTFKTNELTGNELLALLAYGIVCRCQEHSRTAAELSEMCMTGFPMVEQELVLKPFEIALDVVTDARFIAYCPSTGKYRGTQAGKLIAAIGEDLAGAGAKVGVMKFIHWGEYPAEVEGEFLAKQQSHKEKMEKVKEQLKALIEKETIQ